jgi:hypothetical protein
VKYLYKGGEIKEGRTNITIISKIQMKERRQHTNNK